MDKLNINVTSTDTPSREEVALHAAQTWLYAARKTNQKLTSSPKVYSFMARTADGVVVGGLLAKAQLNTLFIEAAWVDPTYQKMGVGVSLRREVMKIAKENHCTHLVAMTYEFYDALNYLLKTEPGLIVVGEVKNCPTPHTLTFLALELPFSEL